MFEQMLEQASRGEVSPELALQLLIQSSDPDKASLLFRTASRIRDQYLGTSLWWSAGISAVLPCEVFPKCTYYTYFTHEYFPMDELLACVKEIEKQGCKQLHLSGGTNRNGYDEEMVRMIQAIREISAIDIEVNLGHLAGGGNQLLGATVSRKLVKPLPGETVIPVSDEICIVNKMPIMQQFMNSMGRRVISGVPLHEQGMLS